MIKNQQKTLCQKFIFWKFFENINEVKKNSIKRKEPGCCRKIWLLSSCFVYYVPHAVKNSDNNCFFRYLFWGILDVFIDFWLLV